MPLMHWNEVFSVDYIWEKLKQNLPRQGDLKNIDRYYANTYDTANEGAVQCTYCCKFPDVLCVTLSGNISPLFVKTNFKNIIIFARLLFSDKNGQCNKPSS